MTVATQGRPRSGRPASGGGRYDYGLHVICPYYTMFPIQFPERQLRKARPGEWVLDPFCGRGTTLFAARAAGLRAVGIDSNPVAAAIAEAKLCSARPAEVVKECRRILGDDPRPAAVPDGEFWAHCFHPDTLRQICAVREALIRDCSSDKRRLLRAIILGRLHGPLRRGSPSYLSNQMPRTYASKPAYAVRYWAKHSLTAPRVDLVELVGRACERHLRNIPPAAGGCVRQGDARTTDFGSLGGPFSWIITSPPYYGMRTYVPDQWLRYWFLGGPDTVPYEFEGQLTHRSPEGFANDLSVVWKRVAEASAPGARLVVRFGGIADRKASPHELLVQSLRSSGRWTLTTIARAGIPARSRRQASQFSIRTLGQPVEEMDYHAVLK